MAKLLYLVHRLPYPPDKGDKVRSYHLLKHLLRRHEVHLGTFVDDPEDMVHVPMLRGLVAGLHVVRLNPLRARAASLTGLLFGDALTVHYYRDAGLARWVEQTLQTHEIDAAVVFSSSMSQYVTRSHATRSLPMLLDLVDVDSAKWRAFAEARSWPGSLLYRREAEKLLATERDAARRAQSIFLVTDKEAALFRTLAPEAAARVSSLGNGVDAEHFSPATRWPSPFAPGERPLVFTGAMDYWPNVDAVAWFAQEVLPQLRASDPTLRLHVVGRNPAPAVRALAGAAVAVSGTVPDVRPYLQHAAAVVAPLRLARGVQNKVLEAMAMARPVVAAADCLAAIGARDGVELIGADEPAAYVQAIEALLADPTRAAAVGAAARARVLRDFSWDSQLSPVDRHLDALPRRVPAVRSHEALA